MDGGGGGRGGDVTLDEQYFAVDSLIWNQPYKVNFFLKSQKFILNCLYIPYFNIDLFKIILCPLKYFASQNNLGVNLSLW